MIDRSLLLCSRASGRSQEKKQDNASRVYAWLRLYCGVFALSLSSFAFTTSAEECETRHGRLPDGRAFRIDVDGNQLVDYIAELEVGIETLNRQLESAQEELRDKSVALNKCSSGGTDSGELKERSLVEAYGKSNELSPVSDSTSNQKCNSNDEKLASAQVEIQTLKDDRDVIATKLGNELLACREKLDSSARASMQLSDATSATDKVPPSTIEQAVVAAIVPPSTSVRAAQDQTEISSGDSPAITHPPKRTRALDALRGSIFTQLNQVRTAAKNCGRETGASGCGQALLTVDKLRQQIIAAGDTETLSSLTKDIQALRALVDQSFRSEREK